MTSSPAAARHDATPGSRPRQGAGGRPGRLEPRRLEPMIRIMMLISSSAKSSEGHSMAGRCST
eukprot:5807141-Pyramimonas_sp.AAC.1